MPDVPAVPRPPFDIATPARRHCWTTRAGAFASFEGWVRDHNDGRAVDGLRYEAYAALAETEGERVLDEALTRFDIVDARCVHRVGDLAHRRTGGLGRRQRGASRCRVRCLPLHHR